MVTGSHTMVWILAILRQAEGGLLQTTAGSAADSIYGRRPSCKISSIRTDRFFQAANV
jgi:hypothetical protein